MNFLLEGRGVAGFNPAHFEIHNSTCSSPQSARNGPEMTNPSRDQKKWNFQGNSTLGETPNRLQLCGNVWMEKKRMDGSFPAEEEVGIEIGRWASSNQFFELDSVRKKDGSKK